MPKVVMAGSAPTLDSALEVAEKIAKDKGIQVQIGKNNEEERQE